MANAGLVAGASGQIMNPITPPCEDGFTPLQRIGWTKLISSFFQEGISGDDRYTNPGLRNEFYDRTQRLPGDDAVKAEVSWTAFPRRVGVDNPTDQDRWREADASRDVQDEYCEWSVQRDPSTQKIKSVSFTCEGPEYWQFLASTDPDKIVSLYRQYISGEVEKGDLFEEGVYNPRNKWNNSTSKGAMHLIQGANTLSAEINLGADATVLRDNGHGQAITDQRKLILCSKYGQAERNSDPLIGFTVNQLVLKKKPFITFADPVGLFFHSFTPVGWVTPDGSNPLNYWKIVRGTPEHAVRAVYEVPSDKGFAVGDITINGEPINFGSQIADAIQIKLAVEADRFGQGDPQLYPCRQKKMEHTMLSVGTLHKQFTEMGISVTSRNY